MTKRLEPLYIDPKRQKEIIDRAEICMFCGCDFLFFKDGAVACDNCQCEGPFVGEHFGSDPKVYEAAVELWNDRSYGDPNYSVEPD